MKKNRTLRISALLLVLTLVTCCALGNTMAKYVSAEFTATDEARVAKWFPSITDETQDFDLFFTEYVAHDDTYTGGTNTVFNTGAGEDRLVAPGTWNYAILSLDLDADDTGVEVAYAALVKDLEITNAITPLVFKVAVFDDTGAFSEMVTSGAWNGDEGTQTALPDLSDYVNSTDAQAAIDAYIDTGIELEDGYSFAIAWAWAFDGNDSTDTGFGEDAADGNAAKVTITIKSQLVQVD